MVVARFVRYEIPRVDGPAEPLERIVEELADGATYRYWTFGGQVPGPFVRVRVGDIVEVKLTSVDQLTYSEFVFSLENPTCFNLITASPLEGQLILDINPSILFPIIDRLLGGGREPHTLTRRPLPPHVFDYLRAQCTGSASRRCWRLS